MFITFFSFLCTILRIIRTLVGYNRGMNIIFQEAICLIINVHYTRIMIKDSEKTPKGRVVEIDGIQYQVIRSKLYRYADLTMDKGFKIVLGRIGSENVLMHLLNRLLGMRIRRLEYRNTEHPGLTEEERSSRFDVYCEDEEGNCFQVEMQNWSQKFFNKRAVYYSSLVLHDQVAKAHRKLKQGKNSAPAKKWDYDFQPLYVVSFLNFKNWNSVNAKMQKNPYISTYRYVNIESNEELGDGTNIVFIDLHSFTKELKECSSLEDIWMYSIKNMFSLENCPDAVKGTEIEDLFIQSELAKMTIEQRIKYEEGIMTENDILNIIDEHVEEGIAKGLAERTAQISAEMMEKGLRKGLREGRAKGRVLGIAEGRAEGRAEGEREMAKTIASKLLAEGFSKEKVSELTGLEINAL